MSWITTPSWLSLNNLPLYSQQVLLCVSHLLGKENSASRDYFPAPMLYRAHFLSASTFLGARTFVYYSWSLRIISVTYTTCPSEHLPIPLTFITGLLWRGGEQEYQADCYPGWEGLEPEEGLCLTGTQKPRNWGSEEAWAAQAPSILLAFIPHLYKGMVKVPSSSNPLCL